MNKWIISLLAATIVTAIAYFVSKQFFAVTEKTATYALIIDNEKNLNPTISILSSRLGNAGFTFNHTLKQKDNAYQVQFDISLKEVKDTQMLNVMLGSKGHLQFWEVYNYEELPSFENAVIEAIDSVYGIQKKEEPKKESSNDSSLVSLMAKPADTTKPNIYNQLFHFLEVDTKKLLITKQDTGNVGKIIRHPVVTAALPKDVIFYYGPEYSEMPEALYLYAIRTRGREKPFLDNSHVKLAIPDFDAFNKQPMVSLQFTNEGAIIWEKLTEKNTGKVIVMSIDNFVCIQDMRFCP